jgi:hypothetical protein
MVRTFGAKLMDSQQAQKAVYVFGHAENELQRLIDQSKLFGGLTEQVFRNAGLGSFGDRRYLSMPKRVRYSLS